jgi:myo-inositol 2-dehydrogenase/D-chiro-inositol 1-dehydrogenase
MGTVHARAIARHLPDVTLAAIAEPRAAAVEALGDAAGTAAVYATADEALDHPGLDGVIVVTPTDTHGAVVTAALQHDLDVFCEKPLTLDPTQSVALRALALERERILQVGFWRRFHPPIAIAKRMLADGAIGRPLLTKLTQWDVDCPPVEWCAPDRSGGIFVDMAVHEFDQVEWFLDDDVVAVEARPLPLAIEELGTVGDYDNAVVWLQLAGGGQAMIDLSRNGRYADDIRIEVLGSDGALFIETIPTGRLRHGTREGITTVWEDPEPDSFTAGIARELAAYTLAVATRDASAVPGPEASLRASELGRAAARSATEGHAVATATTG